MCRKLRINLIITLRDCFTDRFCEYFVFFPVLTTKVTPIELDIQLENETLSKCIKLSACKPQCI